MKQTAMELKEATQILQNYFDAVSEFDYQKMRDQCSASFLLFEDGEIWTVEDHINFLKQYEGKASIDYSLEDVNRTIQNEVVWITHRNKARATIEGQPVDFEWIESAILRKDDGEWKLVLLHSTTAKKTGN